jgi:hypothetical protein
VCFGVGSDGTLGGGAGHGLYAADHGDLLSFPIEKNRLMEEVHEDVTPQPRPVHEKVVHNDRHKASCMFL